VYTLLGADGRPYASENRGTLGGNSKLRIYGQLDCGSARNALGKGYEKIRVFFADEETAIAAGYRPCGNCMRAQYREWKSRQPGTA
jgi:methylphosphotriester-DNA--protein-cysteine methyltransferase